VLVSAAETEREIMDSDFGKEGFLRFRHQLNLMICLRRVKGRTYSGWWWGGYLDLRGSKSRRVPQRAVS
jgi:hypothetical protein